MTLGSVYIVKKNPLTFQLHAIIKLKEENGQKSKNLLIGGDFNVKSSW